MIDNILESIFGAIANAVAEARKRQAELAAEQERARAQFLAARRTIENPEVVAAAPSRGAKARRTAAAAVPPPRPARPAPAAAASTRLFADAPDFARAVVMAEVLGRPLALRDPSTFPPGAAL